MEFRLGLGYPGLGLLQWLLFWHLRNETASGRPGKVHVFPGESSRSEYPIVLVKVKGKIVQLQFK